MAGFTPFFGSGGGGGLASSGDGADIILRDIDMDTAAGAITVSVSTGGSDVASTNRPTRLTTGDYSAYPFATVNAALQALPKNLGLFYHRINIGAGTFTNGFTVQGFVGGGTLDIVGTLSTSSLTSGSNSGTAGSGTSATAVTKPTAAANWTVNNLRGKLFVPASGGGYYADTEQNIAVYSGPCLRRIKANTINTATIDTLNGVDSTTVFTIADPATTIGLSTDAYNADLTYCVGVFSNSIRVLIRNIKAEHADAFYGVLAHSNNVLELHASSLTDTPSFYGAGCYSTEDLTIANCYVTGLLELSNGGTVNAVHNVVDGDGRIETYKYKEAVFGLDADGCSGTALSISNCVSVTTDLNANNCTAVPLNVFNVHHFEIGGAGLSGTNSGTTYGVNVGGGGQYDLTGATIAGSSSSQLLVEGEDALSWTTLSSGTWSRRGTFAYWGSGSTRWAGAVSGYSADQNVQTNNYTLLSSDTGRIIEINSATGKSVTLPNNFTPGFCCTVIQSGAGQVTFSPASGATLVNADSQDKAAGQWAMCTLYVTTNAGGTSAKWVLGGRTGP